MRNPISRRPLTAEEKKLSVERRRAWARAWYAANKLRISEQRRLRYNPSLHAARHLQVAYGITMDKYTSMVKEQDSACAICRKPFEASSRALQANVDHCHRRGTVRAILCSRCNHGIGNFLEDPAIMRAAVRYIENHNDLNRYS